MQPLVLAESRRELRHVFPDRWRAREEYIELTVGPMREDVAELCASFMRLSSGREIPPHPIWSVSRRVQSCNWACVFRLQMAALTANLQFGSSVTRMRNVYFFWSGSRHSFICVVFPTVSFHMFIMSCDIFFCFDWAVLWSDISIAGFGISLCLVRPCFYTDQWLTFSSLSHYWE